jgi:hypothetical protein
MQDNRYGFAVRFLATAELSIPPVLGFVAGRWNCLLCLSVSIRRETRAGICQCLKNRLLVIRTSLNSHMTIRPFIKGNAS